MANESFLDRIVAHKQNEIARAKQRLSPAELEQLAQAQPAGRDFRRALTSGENLAVIAELKRASPSAGVLREHFVPSELARDYAANGAAALSVLTDEKFFQGHLDHLKQAHAACSVPVLRKDFLLEPYQVLEARAFGADAVLLIVAILARQQLAELLAAAREIGVQALVEIHDENEIGIALPAGAGIIGINNRDLRTFAVNLAVTEKLAALIPPNCVRVSESGLAGRADVERLAACGIDAILAGSHLMRQADPGRALSEFVGVRRR